MAVTDADGSNVTEVRVLWLLHRPIGISITAGPNVIEERVQLLNKSEAGCWVFNVICEKLQP
jgi:hypothetical protein